MKPKHLRCAVLMLAAAAPLHAEELRFDTAAQWRQWTLPQGIVELTPQGVIRPLLIRKNINAALDAVDQGGGIRDVGSNRATAALVFDGDPATGWQPASGELEETGWIEVDLGRGVPASRVSLVFDGAAPPFEIFDLLLSTGEQFIDVADVPVPGTLTYRIVERFGANSAHRVDFDIPAIPPTPVQFVRLEALKAAPDARLVEIEVEALGDNLVSDLRERGGAVEIIIGTGGTDFVEATLTNALLLIDGRVNTWWRSGRVPRASNDVWAWITLDLGAVYWVDQVHHIGHIDRGRHFSMNFHEMMTSDGSLAADGSLRWTKHFSGVLPRSIRHQGMVAHRFAPIPTRFLRILFKTWDASCTTASGTSAPNCYSSGHTAEIMVFSEGFPREVRFDSPILDLGGRKNINVLRWDADMPAGTRLELRSRSGDELEQVFTFYDKNLKEVTAKRWDKLIPSFRGPIDTTSSPGADWSPWSNIYATSGQTFLSPSHRRYVKLDARLVSDSPLRTPTLDWVSLDFTDPISERVAAEIYPFQVEPGTTVTFSYWLRASATRAGFDRLVLGASTPLRFVDLHLDGAPVEAEVQGDSTGFWVQLPRRVQSDELVEMRFEAAAFIQSTRFDLFLEDSRLGPDVRQRVEPGDANPQIESSTNIVELPVVHTLFTHVSTFPSVLTPNGDGIGDRLLISLDLINVLEHRPLKLELFDLAGRRVRQISARALAGTQELVWDGRDQSGDLVLPGHYFLRLKVEGDAHSQSLSRVLSIVY